MTVHEHLKRIGACAEARDWAAQYQTAQQAWDECERVDWFAWWDVRVHGRAGIARLVALIEEPCCAANPDPRVRAAFRVAANPASTLNELQAAARAALAARAVGAARAARAAEAAVEAAAWAAEAVVEAAVEAARAAEAAVEAAAVTPTLYRSAVQCPWTETN
jgi:hypothetical protein